MPIVNKTPAIFDLSVKWEPKEQRPLQESGQDQRSKFDFPTFSIPDQNTAGVSVRICDPDTSAQGTLYTTGVIIWDD